MLGIFDSGLGGLTVLRAVRARMPRVDLVYLADQAHVPYGERTPADLHALLARNVRYLVERGVAAVVMGCNTSCAVASRLGWPATEVPILDLIDAAADDVARRAPTRVGVLATVATAASGAYGEAIRARAPGARVDEIGTAELVPLVEAGIVAGPLAREAVSRALAPLREPVDTLVLACTHFPFLAGVVADVAGPGVRLLDPAEAQAARTAARFADTDVGHGSVRYVTTGPLAPFAEALARTVGLGPRDSVEHLDLTPLHV